MSDGPALAPDPRVGIVVLTYNRAAELCRTIERLSALPEAPRIVVVDNGSRDGTVAEVARRFPAVECVALSNNTGAAGRNAGVRRCARPYVAFCDDDTWWEPGSLRVAADLLDMHPSLAIVTGRVLVGETNRLAPACIEMANSPLPAPRWLPGAALLGFHAGASVVRREAFLAAGGFEPRFFIGGEEELLALDLAAAGLYIAYVDALAVHHYPSAIRDDAGRQRLLLRNRLWVAWLRRPPSIALASTFTLARRAKGDRTARWALLEAVRGLPWALRHRRALPRRVEAQLRMLERPADTATVSPEPRRTTALGASVLAADSERLSGRS